MNKTDALEFATQLGWTKADAERAYTNLDLKNSTEQDLVQALLKFAGPELRNRQYLQRAQKGLVTKRTNDLEKLGTEFEQKVEEYEEILQKERSVFVAIVGKIYAVAKVFGMRDPWIENLLFQYEEYQTESDSDTSSIPEENPNISQDSELDLDEPA